MAESIQHKLSRVRPPRVQITYDVEIGNAIQTRELPFVIGIMADLTGGPESGEKTDKLGTIASRKFVQIDRDNFDQVLKKAEPEIALKVQNKIKVGEDGALVEGEVPVTLKFSSFEDFNPRNIIQQDETMRELFRAREALRDLAVKLDGNTALEKRLLDVIKDGKKGDLLALIQQEATPAEPADAE